MVYLGGLALLALGLVWWPVWLLVLVTGVAYLFGRVRKVIAAGLWSLVPYSAAVVVAWDLGRLVGYTRGRLDRIRHGADRYRF